MLTISNFNWTVGIWSFYICSPFSLHILKKRKEKKQSRKLERKKRLCFLNILKPAPVFRQSVESKMATSMINHVYRANFSRLLRPAVRLGQFYSTTTTPTVVEKQEKALEVIDEDGKVKSFINDIRKQRPMRCKIMTIDSNYLYLKSFRR